MDLQDAAEQFCDMLTTGSKALQRLAERELDQLGLDALEKLVGDLLNSAELMKAVLRRPPVSWAHLSPAVLGRLARGRCGVPSAV